MAGRAASPEAGMARVHAARPGSTTRTQRTTPSSFRLRPSPRLVISTRLDSLPEPQSHADPPPPLAFDLVTTGGRLAATRARGHLSDSCENIAAHALRPLLRHRKGGEARARCRHLPPD